jgi:SAM-dependent methyltransferase
VLPRRLTGRFRTLGYASELRFWADFLRTRGGDWPDDFAARLDASRMLEDTLARLVAEIDANPVRILDVGAGPLTVLAARHPSRLVEITATDALGRAYDLLLAWNRITPPVRTRPIAGERLVEAFGEGRFHVVHARNALDHTADPRMVIAQMVAVCAPGGIIVLDHHEDEGEKGGWGALHAWNFRLEGGTAVLWNPTTREALTAGRLGVRHVEAGRINDRVQIIARR